MPLIKSAIKRVKQDKLKRARNNITKRDYKELIKNFIKNLSIGAIEEAKKISRDPTVKSYSSAKELLEDCD